MIFRSSPLTQDISIGLIGYWRATPFITGLLPSRVPSPQCSCPRSRHQRRCVQDATDFYKCMMIQSRIESPSVPVPTNLESTLDRETLSPYHRVCIWKFVVRYIVTGCIFCAPSGLRQGQVFTPPPPPSGTSPPPSIWKSPPPPPPGEDSHVPLHFTKFNHIITSHYIYECFLVNSFQSDSPLPLMTPCKKEGSSQLPSLMTSPGTEPASWVSLTTTSWTSTTWTTGTVQPSLSLLSTVWGRRLECGMHI